MAQGYINEELFFWFEDLSQEEYYRPKYWAAKVTGKGKMQGSNVYVYRKDNETERYARWSDDFRADENYRGIPCKRFVHQDEVSGIIEQLKKSSSGQSAI